MSEGELLAGRFRLTGRIAGGGMGEVWRAEDTRLGRTVAIKLLKPSLAADTEFRARFESEARLVASLNTPHVATLHDYGEDGDGTIPRYYLVMEFVDAGSLHELLAAEGTLSPARTMHLIAAAADGLHTAHLAGIIHRDVKPANILVTGERTVKLIDFGIARAVGGPALTDEGMVIGTMLYSSPEHLADEDPAPPADVYSLGVVAYECLAGAPPFVSHQRSTVRNGHLHRPPPPFTGPIDAAVSDVVMRALRKAPVERWATMADFARACRDAAVVAEEAERFRGEVTDLGIVDGEGEASDVDDTEARPDEKPDSGTPEPVQAESPEPPADDTARPEPAVSDGRRRRFAVALVAVLLLVIGGLTALNLLPGNGSPGNGGFGAPGTSEGPSSGSPSSVTSPHVSDDASDGRPESEKPNGGSETGDGSDDGGDTGGGDPGGENPGGEPGQVKVPNVVGMHYISAKSFLWDEGFTNAKGTRHKIVDEDTKCEVYTQSPDAGTWVDKGTVVSYDYYSDPGKCPLP